MRNLTLMTDLYQLTMMYGYMKKGIENKTAVFDLFFRTSEDMRYGVCCGLEQAVEYITNLHFEEDEIEYLRSLNLFDEEFLGKLKNFRFTGDVYAVPEGTVVFPYEPLLTVKAPLFEAQFVETALLNIINHQTLIATKASMIVHAAAGKAVMEFGLRRAQGPDAGIYGARAAMIGGCVGTSNVLTGKMFDVPVLGTHAHSWIMSFPTELDAFRAYAKVFPDNCVLLVDTYDTLKSGVPNAIIALKELKEQGYVPKGIRLDSGDLAYLSKKARKMLDEAGLPEAKIYASGDIDEIVLQSLHVQGAQIDVYGIGTKLITSHSHPSLGGVYKLAAIEEDGELKPRIKISNTVEKVTNPGVKTVYRIYDAEKKAAADLISLRDETFDVSKPLTIYHPTETWKTMTFTDYEMKDIMVAVIKDGKLVYDMPSIDKICTHAKASLDEFYDEYKRITNPHIYKVDLSDKLYNMKKEILRNRQKV